MGRYYRQQATTQAEVLRTVENMRVLLRGLNLKVTPNRSGHRIECEACHWSSCHGTITAAKDHAATHGSRQATEQLEYRGHKTSCPFITPDYSRCDCGY